MAKVRGSISHFRINKSQYLITLVIIIQWISLSPLRKKLALAKKIGGTSSVFKPCFFLLKTREARVNFCLQYREWFDQCPAQCPEIREDESGDFEEVRAQNYDYECLNFTRNQDGHYFCTQYLLENPLCHSCLYTVDKDTTEFTKDAWDKE
ncbi:MAG: hypothetical protein ACFE9L_18315 [Candidatus Hodarchaeota archaeon]